jgi:WD40 repeat protein
VVVLDSKSGRELFTVPGLGAAFDPKGRWLAASGEAGVGLWDEDGKLIRTLVGVGRRCRRLAISPDGQTVAAGDEGGNVILWDVETGAVLASWQAQRGPVEAVAFHPSGKLIATAGEGVAVWDDEGNLQVRHDPLANVSTVAFSPDGELLAAGSGRRIRLWEADSGRERPELSGHTGRVFQVIFSPDRRMLISGGEDRSVRLWDVESGQEMLSLPGVAGRVHALAISPDGRRIVARDYQVITWEVGQD